MGTAAGLTLGVGTTITVDILSRLNWGKKNELHVLRLTTFLALLAALALVVLNLDSAIMHWSFLSMGLRGATLCLPLLAAVWLGDRTTRIGGALSISTAPLAVLVAGIAGIELPPLFLGLLVSLAAMLAGFWLDRRRTIGPYQHPP